MKNKLFLAILFASLGFPSLANSKNFEIAGDTIDFNINADSSISRGGDELSEQISESRLIRVQVYEHVVIRSETSKSSFSPLKSNVNKMDGITTELRNLIGVDIPETYAEIMTLYQSFYKERGATKRECKVLVLDNLLDESHQKRLRDFLELNKVTIEKQKEFFMFECSASNRGY
jgi:hypothetical protein